MKETIIIAIILIIIISGNIFINKYLTNSSSSLIDDLEDLKEKINNNPSDINKLSDIANSIYKKWKKTGQKWAIIVLHQELDAIETSLIKMKTEIKEDNLDITQEELETSIFLINHIREKERFCIKNIF